MVDNVAHYFLRDFRFDSSVFLFGLTILLNHFFNMFLMRQICCSNWPPRNYFVTTFFPHFFLLKLPYPKSNCVYINTFNPTHCLHMVMYIDGRNFYCSPELNNGMLLELPILTAFISIETELEFLITVGSGLNMMEGRYHLTAWNRFYSVFITLIKT